MLTSQTKMTKPLKSRIDQLVAEACAWMASHLWIIPKDSKDDKLIRLVPNAEQQELMWWYFAQREAGINVRIIILKARKVGMSTIIEALGFMELHTRPNRRALVTAHDDEASQTLFRMTQIYYEECPDKKPIKSDKPTKREIRWIAPHRSLFDVQTAGKLTLARGDTLHFLHCSEVPYWPHAKATLTSALNALHPRGQNAVFLEATANGVEEFCSRWRKAVKYRQVHPDSLEGYIPIFFSWLNHAEYTMPLAPGEAVEPVDEHEEKLVRMGATSEQLKWRRQVVEDNCNGDIELFQQEFPADPEEAFRVTGSNPIPAEVIEFHKSTCRPGERVVLDRDEWDKVRVRPWAGMGPYWEVWERPQEFRDYSFGGDVAEGALSEPTDPRSERDFSYCFLLNRETMEQAAEWHGRMDPDLFGEQLRMVGEWYGMAWGSPETNPPGWPTLMALRRAGYPNLYLTEEDDNRIKGRKVTTYGWRTTKANRHSLIMDWIAYCRSGAEHLTGNSHRIIIHSARLVAEEESFYVNKSGKAEHKPGFTDDCIFGGAIALQMHLRCPRQLRRPFDVERREAVERDKPAYSWAGGHDPGIAAEPVGVESTG